MQNILYLIQEVRDLNTNIYKIGKTTRSYVTRINEYPIGTYEIRVAKVDDCKKREIELINIFKNKYKLVRGREYFSGNIKSMIIDFTNFCNQFVNLLDYNTNHNITINTTNNTINNYNYKFNTDNHSKYICEKCNYEFSTQQSLDRHLDKKFKCNDETKYQCKICNKYFKYNKNLKEHIDSSPCKSKVLNSNNSNDIITILDNILNSTVSNNDKTFLITKLDINMNDNDILKLLDMSIDNIIKLHILLENTKKNNNEV